MMCAETRRRRRPMGILARVAACTIALLACAMPGARAYTHARDIGLTAVVTPSTTSATRGEDVDVYGLNFSPGSSAAASIPGQLVCVFGSSPGNTSVGAVIAGTTGVRCAAPTTFEGFVALGLSSNGGVDAVLFHELGMSSVLNFVREAKGMLTRASPNVATRGDVVRLTGRTRRRWMDAQTSSAPNANANGEERRVGSRHRIAAWGCTCRVRSCCVKFRNLPIHRQRRRRRRCTPWVKIAWRSSNA